MPDRVGTLAAPVPERNTFSSSEPITPRWTSAHAEEADLHGRSGLPHPARLNNQSPMLTLAVDSAKGLCSACRLEANEGLVVNAAPEHLIASQIAKRTCL